MRDFSSLEEWWILLKISQKTAALSERYSVQEVSQFLRTTSFIRRIQDAPYSSPAGGGSVPNDWFPSCLLKSSRKTRGTHELQNHMGSLLLQHQVF